MSTMILNPASTLEEVLGVQMERALKRFLYEFCEEHGYQFVSSSVNKGKKKLFMSDDVGTSLSVDAVMSNSFFRPLILFEFRDMFYRTSNSDKVDWLCTAHPAIRRRYHSIRSSIAVLAGNWSSSSITMMKSFDITIFLIPFERICDFLATCGIRFDWDEKDRKTAQDAWRRYTQLTEAQQLGIGEQMVALVKDDLHDRILNILDDSVEREIENITIELHSNLGEVKVHEFENIPDAIEFLNSAELKTVFLSTDSLTLFDFPPPDEP